MHFDHYLSGVKRQAAEIRAKRAADREATKADPRAALRDQVTQWYAALPLDARQPHYFMEDLARLFNATQQQLGMALYELGWTRKRVWLNDGPYRRQWFPPVDWGAFDPVGASLRDDVS